MNHPRCEKKHPVTGRQCGLPASHVADTMHSAGLAHPAWFDDEYRLRNQTPGEPVAGDASAPPDAARGRA